MKAIKVFIAGLLTLALVGSAAQVGFAMKPVFWRADLRGAEAFAGARAEVWKLALEAGVTKKVGVTKVGVKGEGFPPEMYGMKVNYFLVLGSAETIIDDEVVEHPLIVTEAGILTGRRLIIRNADLDLSHAAIGARYDLVYKLATDICPFELVEQGPDGIYIGPPDFGGEPGLGKPELAKPVPGQPTTWGQIKSLLK